MTQHSEKIAAQLQRPADELEALNALDAASADKLAADIERANGLQSEHLKSALEDAVSHVPRLLRGPMRKMLGV